MAFEPKLTHLTPLPAPYYRSSTPNQCNQEEEGSLSPLLPVWNYLCILASANYRPLSFPSPAPGFTSSKLFDPAEWTNLSSITQLPPIRLYSRHIRPELKGPNHSILPSLVGKRFHVTRDNKGLLFWFGF